jgi:hypothetical protein
MPDCVFKLTRSRIVTKEGEQFTVSMDPALQPGCRFSVSIDGKQVSSPGDRVGDLKVIGFGAAGTATFEIKDDNPKSLIAFTVLCENCGPTSRGLETESVDEPQGILLSPPAEYYYRQLQREREREEERREREREREEERRERSRERQQEREDERRHHR